MIITQHPPPPIDPSQKILELELEAETLYVLLKRALSGTDQYQKNLLSVFQLIEVRAPGLIQRSKFLKFLKKPE